MNIVSYRGPNVAGGVSSGLKRIFDEQAEQEAHWFFINDKPALNSLAKGAEEPELLTQISDELLEGHYRFCNEFIWPLMHELVSMLRFSDFDYRQYCSFNSFIASHIAGATAGNVNFIQDYQLALLPSLMSKSTCKSKMFWHIPWPKRLPNRYLNIIKQIAKGILAADVIGFHTDEYAYNFLDFVSNNMPQYEVVYGTMQVRLNEQGLSEPNNHESQIVVEALGIDLNYWSGLASQEPEPSVYEELSRLRDKVGSIPLVLSVDRVDYTKAVLDRLEIIDRFLAEFPEWRSKVSFVQVCPRSREGVFAFDKYFAECENLCQAVNDRWATSDWTPIHWINEGLSPATLAYLYRKASVMLVNPRRDGLNLTAEEFVVCQKEEDPGVLLLSSGAGAWTELGQFALPGHPDKKTEVLNSIQQALTMPLESRLKLLKGLNQRISKHSPEKWWNQFSEPEKLKAPPLRPAV